MQARDGQWLSSCGSTQCKHGIRRGRNNSHEQEQRHGLVDRGGGEYEPFNSDLAGREGGPFSSFGPAPAGAQHHEQGLDSVGAMDRPAGAEAYMPPHVGGHALDSQRVGGQR